jgi:hypothetical protein
MILVKKSDCACQECGGQLEVVDANDYSMDVVCRKCDNEFTTEPDGLDSACDYWGRAMVEFGGW